MEKITYGVPGLVDWIAEIKAGAATLRVHFSGGALTTYGVTPAEYTTANPFIQKVIEQSSEFKNGRIITLRRTEIPDSNKSVKPAKRKLQAATQSPALKPDANNRLPTLRHRNRPLNMRLLRPTKSQSIISKPRLPLMGSLQLR